MAPATSSVDTRERILTATNELFRRQGFNGTSLSQIVKASESTTGSLYHFFPGGKDELTAEVLRSSGQTYGDFVELIVRAAADAATGMQDAFVGAADTLNGTDFIDLCPIGTVAREVASTHEPLREVASAVMQKWVAQLKAIFTDAGIGEGKAESLSIMCVASIEGGFMLARTHRDTATWLAIGEFLTSAIRDALPS